MKGIRVHLEEVFPFDGKFVLVTDGGRFITVNGAGWRKDVKDEVATFTGVSLELNAKQFATQHNLAFSKAVLVFAHQIGDQRRGREGAIQSEVIFTVTELEEVIHALSKYQLSYTDGIGGWFNTPHDAIAYLSAK